MIWECNLCIITWALSSLIFSDFTCIYFVCNGTSTLTHIIVYSAWYGTSSQIDSFHFCPGRGRRAQSQLLPWPKPKERSAAQHFRQGKEYSGRSVSEVLPPFTPCWFAPTIGILLMGRNGVGGARGSVTAGCP